MSEPGPAVDSEQELRWRAWQEKCRHSNQRPERRMKIVLWVVAAVFIFIVILYFRFRPRLEPKVLRSVVAESLSLTAKSAAQLTAALSISS